MVVAAPMNEEELRNMMYTAQLDGGAPFSIRYPRGAGVMVDWIKPLTKIEVGKGRKIKDGNDIAIVTIGHVGNLAATAISKLESEGHSIALHDMRFVKPLDEELLKEIGQKFDTIITVEDGCLPGGFGSAVIEWFNDNGYKTKVIRLGIPDRFVEHGTQLQLYKECGFDAESIYNAAKKLLIQKLSMEAI